VVARRPNRLTPRTVTRRIASGPSDRESPPAGLLAWGERPVTMWRRWCRPANSHSPGLRCRARDTYPYAFGPGMPLQPAPLDPSGGTPAARKPRQWEYPCPGIFRFPGVTGRLVPWQLLRTRRTVSR